MSSRFAFLSDDIAQDLLSRTDIFNALRDAALGLFDGANGVSVRVDAEDTIPEICGLHALEGRHLIFENVVTPKSDLPTSICAVQEAISASLHAQTYRAAQSIATSPLHDWIREYPTQVACAAASLYWACEVSKSIARNESESMQELRSVASAFDSQLSALHKLIKNDPADKVAISVCKAILPLRSVIDDMIKTSSLDSWENNMHYEWDHEQKVLYIALGKQRIECQGEFQSVLSSTPLTAPVLGVDVAAAKSILAKKALVVSDQIFYTTIDAFRLLARLAWRPHIVLSCGQMTTSSDFERFLQQALPAGFWVLIDEIDTVESSEFPAAFKAFSAFQRAIQRGDSHAMIGDIRVSVNPNAALFMATSCSIPRVLVELEGFDEVFDSFEVKPASQASAINLMLSMAGFSFNVHHGEAFAAVFQNLVAELSSQPHYNFTNRSIQMICSSAGKALDDSTPAESQTAILARAIADYVRPRLVDEDISIFECILSKHFSGQEFTPIANPRAVELIEKFARETNQAVSAKASSKVLEFLQLLRSCHGVAVIGSNSEERETFMKVVRSVLHDLENEPKVYEVPVGESDSSLKLFGCFDKETEDWVDGPATAAFRQVELLENARQAWIVFHGKLSADWLESLNTVLDDNKLLCLMNGDRIYVPSFAKVLLLSDSMFSVPRSVVARCGVLYLSAGIF
eukprot:TRINITY_DN6695_c0_g1_i1.p1 TRINITY_DN6695_c0_g1~~TRINITY_DN6695_c0_g1_i1.p1  ORF type:complete len:688 (-),score=126.86 TRINITY_DN6695_c0_g1_i1:164-2227(-)